VAQGVQTKPTHNSGLLSHAAPFSGTPASHPENGSPPSGMKAPTRLPKPSARRGPTCPDGPASEANRALCDGWAGESCQAPDPRPKTPRLSGTSRCTPNATPDAAQAGGNQWRGRGNIIPLRFITGKSSVSRPNTHRATADMPAIQKVGVSPKIWSPRYSVRRFFCRVFSCRFFSASLRLTAHYLPPLYPRTDTRIGLV
jgi:hypothetical protein